MDATTKLIYMVIDVLLPLSLGYYCRQRNWLSEGLCNKVIEFNITVFGTILALLSFWTLPLSRTLFWLPVFGIFLSFLPGLAGYCVAQYKYTGSGPNKASYLASAMLSNIGTLSGLCCFFLLGEQSFAYIQIIAMFQNIVFLSFCFPMSRYYNTLLHKNTAACEKLSFVSLFFNRNQVPLLGAAAGLLLYAGGIPRPEMLSSFFTTTIHLSAWSSFLPIGYSIRFSKMKYYYRSILDLLPVKFIITPLISYLIASQLFTDPVLIGTVAIAASAPVGMNAVILARLFNFNVHVASAAFVLSSVVFLLVMYPAFFFLLH